MTSDRAEKERGGFKFTADGAKQILVEVQRRGVGGIEEVARKREGGDVLSGYFTVWTDPPGGLQDAVTERGGSGREREGLRAEKRGRRRKGVCELGRGAFALHARVRSRIPDTDGARWADVPVFFQGLLTSRTWN